MDNQEQPGIGSRIKTQLHRLYRALPFDQRRSVTIIGSGSWGTALAKVLLEQCASIVWYMRSEEKIAEFKKNKHNPTYLSSVRFDTSRIDFVSDINQAVERSAIILFVTPSPYLKTHLQQLTLPLSNKIVISAIKGIIPGENLICSDFFHQVYNVPEEQIVILSGPSHAEEIALNRLTYLTIASVNLSLARRVAQLFDTQYITTSTSVDVNGIQYAAVMKNVYAIAAGICHGLKYGDNFKAVLVAASVREMKTSLRYFSSLSRNIDDSVYLGDLLVTCYSQFSRNYIFGTMIGRGYSVRNAQMEMHMIAEGYYGAKCLHVCNKRLNRDDMPILSTVYNILYHSKPARQEIEHLTTMLR